MHTRRMVENSSFHTWDTSWMFMFAYIYATYKLCRSCFYGEQSNDDEIETQSGRKITRTCIKWFILHENNTCDISFYYGCTALLFKHESSHRCQHVPSAPRTLHRHLPTSSIALLMQNQPEWLRVHVCFCTKWCVRALCACSSSEWKRGR